MDLKAQIAAMVRAAHTSFYYAFVFLPRDQREAIFSAYAFCRPASCAAASSWDRT